MTLPAGVQPVRADEILYRRVPRKWYDPTTGFVLDAFIPTKQDADGLSLSRDCVTPEDVAGSGTPDREFWVAQLKAGAVIAAEMSIEPDAHDHAVIPELSRIAYETVEGKPVVKGLARTLIALVTQVHGPFPGRTPRA